ncbi:MAG TPA: radical SAM protein [Thermoguttaceae bacterium]|nr:radical SAM protein [Thermoguttaceae bacterium]
MRILLIEPPVGRFDIATAVFALPPPHHLERLAGALTGDHDVRILDMRIEDDLVRHLDGFRPHMVGASCVAANYHLARGVLATVKCHNPETFTVIGGHHPSLAPEECNDPDIDFVVIGEGEMTLRELAHVCEQGKDVQAVRGIGYRTADGEFRVNPPRQLMDLDDLPPAARGLTAKYRKRKLYYRASWRPTDCVISSRGCPYKCKFCGIWKVNRGRYRVRKAEAIADEIESISDPYVNFIDDNTLDHIPTVTRLAELLEERQIKKTYEFYGRADTVVRHPDLIERLRGVGLKLLLLGLESHDQAALDSFDKRISADTNRRAIEICHASDVEIVAYLIVKPSFDRDDFRRLSDYVAENRLTHPIFTILSPFPGTDLYEEVKGTLITDSYELIDFYHTVMPTRLPLDEFYVEFLGLYRKAYPLKNFFLSAIRDRAVLTPGNLLMNLRVRKKMSQLRSHHDWLAKHASERSVREPTSAPPPAEVGV